MSLLSPAVGAAAPFDAGHVIISARDIWGTPGFDEVDLSGVLVEDGIHIGPVHAAWEDYARWCACSGFAADGPFWDIQVHAKPGLFLRSISLSGSVVGTTGISVFVPPDGALAVLMLFPGLEMASFPPGTTDATLFLAAGFEVSAEAPLIEYDEILHFGTVSAVPEPRTAGLVTAVSLTMMAIVRRRA